MKNIIEVQGRLIALHPATEQVKQIDRACLLIQTNVRNSIDEVIDLELNGETFEVKVQEVHRQHVMKEVM